MAGRRAVPSVAGPRVLTEIEAAALLHRSVSELQGLRRRGPARILVGTRTVRYLEADVIAWLVAHGDDELADGGVDDVER